MRERASTRSTCRRAGLVCVARSSSGTANAGGRADVQSSAGKGTVITLSWPVVPVEGEDAAFAGGPALSTDGEEVRA